MRLSHVTPGISHIDADLQIHEAVAPFEPSVFAMGGLSSSPDNVSSHMDAGLNINEEVSSVGPRALDSSELSFGPSSLLDDLPPHVKTLYTHAKRHGAWDDLVKHPFPDQMAKGTASLNGFRHYMIQDAKYQEYYARVRMQSIANSRSGASSKEIVEFAETISRSLKHSIDMRNICIQQLGVPEKVVDNEDMSDQLKKTIELYEGVIKDSRGDWLAMHIVLLPCIMGYYTIASELLERPEIVTNTPCYPSWIEANASASSFKRYISFINDRIEKRDPSQRHWDYWKQLFIDACGTEKAFFDLGLKDSDYDIVEHGTYTIRSYGNRRFLSLESDDSNEVVMQQNPGILGVWALRPTYRGYNIVSHRLDVSLVATTTNSFPPYCEVKCMPTHEPQWSINPIRTPKGNGYQLLWSPHLQYALSADVSGRESKVIAANNYKGTDQVWILEPYRPDTEVGTSPS